MPSAIATPSPGNSSIACRTSSVLKKGDCAINTEEEYMKMIQIRPRSFFVLVAVCVVVVIVFTAMPIGSQEYTDEELEATTLSQLPDHARDVKYFGNGWVQFRCYTGRLRNTFMYKYDPKGGSVLTLIDF
jgi:hypothetical protein